MMSTTKVEVKKPKNLSNSKFIAPKAIMDPKTNESKLNWN